MPDIPGLAGVDVFFGDADAPLPDWRAAASPATDDDEDAPLTEAERQGLVAVLGFDPAELNDTPDRYAGEHWVTIGGDAEDGKKHAGGTPILLDGEGRIQSHQNTDFHGKHISEIGGGSRSGTKSKKPAHEMTPDEWVTHLHDTGQRGHYGEGLYGVKLAHEEEIRQALAEGKEVPSNILALYPNLWKQAKKGKPKPAPKKETPALQVEQTKPPAGPGPAPQAAQAPPHLSGHPLAGKSPEEQRKWLFAHGNARSEESVQYPGPSPEHAQVSATVLQAVQQQQARNPYQRLTIKQLYETAKAASPGLTLWQFQGDLAAMDHSGLVELGLYSQALGTLSEADLPFVMPYRRDPKFYVELGTMKHSRIGQAKQYAAGEHWVTVGAEQGADGKKHGGTPVKLDAEGKVVGGGPPEWQGSHVSSIGKKTEEKKEEKKEEKSGNAIDSQGKPGYTVGVESTSIPKVEGGAMGEQEIVDLPAIPSHLADDYNRVAAAGEEGLNSDKVWHGRRSSLLEAGLLREDNGRLFALPAKHELEGFWKKSAAGQAVAQVSAADAGSGMVGQTVEVEGKRFEVKAVGSPFGGKKNKSFVYLYAEEPKKRSASAFGDRRRETPPDDPMERMEWEARREQGRTGELPGA